MTRNDESRRNRTPTSALLDEASSGENIPIVPDWLLEWDGFSLLASCLFALSYGFALGLILAGLL